MSAIATMHEMAHKGWPVRISAVNLQGMNRKGEQVFKDIADEFWESVPGVRSLWFRAEADDIVDLRFDLAEDTWASRREAIERIVEVKRGLRDVFVNFSFILPDEAYAIAQTGTAGKPVRSFA